MNRLFRNSLQTSKHVLAPYHYGSSTKLMNQPSSRNFISVIQKYIEAYRRYGFKGCYYKLSYTGDIKFGYLVGKDKFGNRYYEDPTLPHGQSRYVESPHFEYDSSQIPPAWHCWMQHTTDAKPLDDGQKPETWHVMNNSTVDHGPYSNHLGPVGKYEENWTGYRQRGYGVGSEMHSADDVDMPYLQPNHPLRRRKRGEAIPKRVEFDEIREPEEPEEPSRDLNLK